MECHAHEITHPIGPRPREPMPMRDHAHMGPRPRGHAQGSPVLQDKGRSAPRAPAAHPQGGCLPLGASPPLSGHGVCKALRSPLRSRPLTSSANHWANTRCPVGVTDRKSAEEGGQRKGGKSIPRHTPQGPSWQCTGRATWCPGRDPSRWSAWEGRRPCRRAGHEGTEQDGTGPGGATR